MPARYSRAVRRAKKKRAELPQLLLQKPGSRVFAFAFQRIAADELAESIGGVRGRPPVRAHLVENDMRTRLGSLKCGLTAGETRANDVNRGQPLF